MSPGRSKAIELARGLAPSPNNLLKVARETSEDDARWAFAQWDLRRRAAAKFDRADSMLFVEEALEQATTLEVARWRAKRFPAGAPVVDVGCGIGGDLIALAERGPVIGWEPDAERCACAKWNLRAYGLDGVVLSTSSNQESLNSIPLESAIFADPARRVQGKRTLDPSEFSPDVAELAQRMKKAPIAAMKLSPLLPDEFLHSLGADRLEFVSYGGECREALLWYGVEAKGVFAVRVEEGAELAGDSVWDETDEPLAWVFDADPAVVRAHALGNLAEDIGGVGLGTSPGYLTGPDRVPSPWCRAYEVLWSGPADLKTIRRAAASLGVRVAEVKKRGVKEVDGDKWLRELRKGEGEPVSLILYPAGKVRACLARGS